MTKNDHETPDPEDLFSDSRMSFGDHIEDLRHVFVAGLVRFRCGHVDQPVLGKYVLQIIVVPVEDQLNRFEEKTLDMEMDKKRQDYAANPSSSLRRS